MLVITGSPPSGAYMCTVSGSLDNIIRRRTDLPGASCYNVIFAVCLGRYSQGCFIGCPECDHESGRRQTDLCKLGFVGQLLVAKACV